MTPEKRRFLGLLDWIIIGLLSVTIVLGYDLGRHPFRIWFMPGTLILFILLSKSKWWDSILKAAKMPMTPAMERPVPRPYAYRCPRADE